MATPSTPLLRRLSELLRSGDAEAVVLLGGHEAKADDAGSQYVLGLALRRLGRTDEARRRFAAAGDVAAGAARVALADLFVHDLHLPARAIEIAEAAHADGAWGAAGLLAHLHREHADDPDLAERWATAAVIEGDPVGHWELALVHAGRDEGVLAGLELDRALALGCGGSHQALAWIAEKAGRFEEAEAEYRWAIRTSHDPPHNELGMLLARQRGREAEAEAAFRAAIDKADVNAPNNLGRLLAAAGRDDEAEPLFRQAIDLGQPYADNNLANLLLRRGDVDEAEHHFLVAIERGESEAMTSYALLLADRGDRDGRDQLLRRSAAGGNPVAHLNLGVFAEREGRLQDAEQHYRDAIARPSENSAYHHWALGRLLAQDGERRDESERHHLLAAEGGEPEAHVSLARLYEQDGRLGDAERHLRLAVDAGAVGALMKLVTFVGRHDRLAASEGVLRSTVVHDPEHADALTALGAIFLERGYEDRAIELFERAAEHGNRGAMLNLGQLYARRGRYADARSMLLGCEALEGPRGGVAAYNLAFVEAKLGADEQEVERLLRRSLDLGFAAEHALVQELRRRRPDDPEIEALHRRWIDREDSATARRSFARHLLDRNRETDAIEQLEAALGLDADPAIADELRAARARTTSRSDDDPPAAENA